METLLNQFLESFEKTHELMDMRMIEEEEEDQNEAKEDICANKMTDEETKEEGEGEGEGKEKNNKRCVVCESNYSSERGDKYNWLFKGLKCCSSPVHISCLVRWRISKKRSLDNQLIVWCPKCSPKTYIPAVWFFNEFGDVLEKFIRRHEYLSNGRPSICFRYLIIKHWEIAPRYFVAMKEQQSWSKLSAIEIINTEREKLNLLTAMSEMVEKKELNGLQKFIENYNSAKFVGNFGDIPPLDSAGNRIIAVSTASNSDKSG